MTIMGVEAALTVLLFFVAAVDADKRVEISRKKVTLTCPQIGTWYYKNVAISTVETKTHQFDYDNSKKGLYHCAYGADKYYFYVQGKVCESCFELDAKMFGLAIAGDLAVTVVIMMIIYKCTKRRSSDGSSNASKSNARQGGRPPPVPNPDYEKLQPRTRNQDTYSMLNKMG